MKNCQESRNKVNSWLNFLLNEKTIINQKSMIREKNKNKKKVNLKKTFHLFNSLCISKTSKRLAKYFIKMSFSKNKENFPTS